MHVIADLSQLNNVCGGTVRYVDQDEIDRECRSQTFSNVSIFGLGGFLIGSIVHPAVGMTAAALVVLLLMDRTESFKPEQCNFKPGFYNVI